MIVHVLAAEHFHVPGLVMKVFATVEAARREAADVTNIMLADNGNTERATAEDWATYMERLQEQHGAQFCYVEISAHTVEG